MKCKCGKIMVVEDPNCINASNPPTQWYVCKCGRRDLKQVGPRIDLPKSVEERWNEANKEEKDEMD